MRTLEKNEIKCWRVYPTIYVDEIDSEGFYTGNKIPSFGIPTEISISMYPFDGSINRQPFGTDCSFDMLATSNNVVLDKDTLLYYTMPTSNFETTYDFRVDKINKSINTYQYGLVART